MTKVHFIALADSIRQHNAELDGAHPEYKFNSVQIQTLARFCGAQNPAFKRGPWLDYIAGKCGANGSKVK